MEHMIDVMESATGRRVRDLPGAGAAGGLGAALMTLFQAAQDRASRSCWRRSGSERGSGAQP